MKRKRAGGGKTPKGPRSPHKMFIALALVAGLGVLYGWNSVFLAPKGRERTAAQGYAECLVAENIAWESDPRGFTARGLARALVKGWQDSPPHRKQKAQIKAARVSTIES